MNVSGVVVRTTPRDTEKVCALLEKSGLCEIHGNDATAGKIIITIEGSSIKEESRILEAIQKMEGVLTADLAYSYSEQDFKPGSVVPREIDEN